MKLNTEFVLILSNQSLSKETITNKKFKCCQRMEAENYENWAKLLLVCCFMFVTFAANLLVLTSNFYAHTSSHWVGIYIIL